MLEARAYRQNETFAAALQFARTRGDHPGARARARDPRGDRGGARPRKEAGEERVILFGLCGHGNFDLAAYDAYLAGHARGPGVLAGRHGRGARAPAGGRAGDRRARRLTVPVPRGGTPPATARK